MKQALFQLCHSNRKTPVYLRAISLAHKARAYLQFLYYKATKSISTPRPVDGMLVPQGHISAFNSTSPRYTPEWRKAAL